MLANAAVHSFAVREGAVLHSPQHSAWSERLGGVLAAQGSALVLLDEPTAHLDVVTEAAVYSALFAEFSNACIVSSVHRLHLLERFDEVLFMDQGRLIGQAPARILALTLPEFRALATPSGPPSAQNIEPVPAAAA